VFEGMFDFLTFLSLYGIQEHRGRVYILHSAALAGRVAEHVKRAASGQPAVLWLDNDAAGAKAAEVLFQGLADHAGEVGTMNHLYDGFKDLNDWYTATKPLTIKQATPKAYIDTAWNQVRPAR